MVETTHIGSVGINVSFNVTFIILKKIMSEVVIVSLLV